MENKMQVVHEVKRMTAGQHVALVKDETTGQSPLSASWGVALDSRTGHGVIIACRDLAAAAHLFQGLEEAFAASEITAIVEG